MLPAHRNLKKKFDTLSLQYESLKGSLVSEVENMLRAKNVAYITVKARIKEWKSFAEKIDRKRYQKPFEEMTDIIGLRVVVRDVQDINPTIKILSDEFNVNESHDKNEKLDPDQFGYRSYHMIVKIKKDWGSPVFRPFQDTKIELQIRSELMNTWAGLSHELFYKQEVNSKEVTRRLYRLSALMEIADLEISQIMTARSESLIKQGRVQKLQKILDKYLPNRRRPMERPLEELYDDMEKYNFVNETLVQYLITRMPELLQIEREAFSDIPKGGSENRWWQAGVVYGIMFLTIEEFWNKDGKKYSPQYVSTIEKYRKSFKSIS